MISGQPLKRKQTPAKSVLQSMILAAGYGTRLQPLTNKTPKAMIKLNNKALLEIVLDKMFEAGITNIAVNGHHHAKQITDFLKKYMSRTKVSVHFSYEEEILDTGGGIKKMIPLLESGTAVLVQNVDILTDLNLRELYDFHLSSGASCTLAIQNRKTDRPLLFDEKMLFCGRGPLRTSALVRKPKGELREFGFCGIQVVAPELFLEYPGNKFSSIDVYLRASSWDKKISGYCINSAYWRDLGQLSDLQQAEKDVHKGFIEI